MRVLVIEDERTLAGFVEQSLRAEGYAVTVAHDGESGQARALTGDYALVLLDLTLPGRDGLEVLKAIRAQLPDLPVIALTARDGHELHLTAREFEVLAYLMRHPGSARRSRHSASAGGSPKLAPTAVTAGKYDLLNHLG